MAAGQNNAFGQGRAADKIGGRRTFNKTLRGCGARIELRRPAVWGTPQPAKAHAGRRGALPKLPWRIPSLWRQNRRVHIRPGAHTSPTFEALI